jgi:hypothetical protein
MEPGKIKVKIAFSAERLKTKLVAQVGSLRAAEESGRIVEEPRLGVVSNPR